MKIIVLMIAFAVTGCATPPQWLASHFDDLDRCQPRNLQGATAQERAQNQPKYCGSSRGRTVIYSTPQAQPLGAPIGYTQTR